MHILWDFITFHSILELIDYLAMLEMLGWFSWLSWFFNSLRVGCFPFLSFLEIHWEICKYFCICLSLFNVFGFVPCSAFWFCSGVQNFLPLRTAITQKIFSISLIQFWAPLGLHPSLKAGRLFRWKRRREKASQMGHGYVFHWRKMRGVAMMCPYFLIFRTPQT